LDEEVELALVVFGPVQLHLAAFHRALQHAVTDRGPRELHHRVRSAGQQGRAVDHVSQVEVGAYGESGT
jgi:hypothetical protein